MQRELTDFYFVESALFGVPLSTLLENDQKIKASATVPLFLQTVRVMSDHWMQPLSDRDRPVLCLHLPIGCNCHLCTKDVLIQPIKTVSVANACDPPGTTPCPREQLLKFSSRGQQRTRICSCLNLR